MKIHQIIHVVDRAERAAATLVCIFFSVRLGRKLMYNRKVVRAMKYANSASAYRQVRETIMFLSGNRTSKTSQISSNQAR